MISKPDEQLCFAQFQSQLQIKNIGFFKQYLEEVYYSITSQTEDGKFSLKAFIELMKLPVFISEKMFSSFDVNLDNSLSHNEFLDGITNLYTGSFISVATLIFKIYDFNRSGVILKQNVKLLLSYIPISDNNKTKYEHQLESQDELERILKLTFPSNSNNLPLNDYLKSIHENQSDIFLILIGYLYNVFPFNYSSMETFSQIKTSPTKSKTVKIKPQLPQMDDSPSKAIKKLSINANKFYSTNITLKDLKIKEENPKAKSTEVIKRKTKTKNASMIFNDETKSNEVNIEGYIIDIKIKKVYVSIIGDDLFIFKNLMREDLVQLLYLKSYYVIEGTVVFEKITYSSLNFYLLSKNTGFSQCNLVVCFLKKEIASSLYQVIIKKNSQKRIEDLYEVSKLLGEGAFGQVKLAQHIKSGCKYAVKILNKNKLSKNQNDMARNEADIMKLCCHPNIVGLIDVIETHEYIHIVMEYIEGVDLFSFLDERGCLSEDLIRKCMKLLAQTIKYLHTFGIVHRDLKLDNIMIVVDRTKISENLIQFKKGKERRRESKILNPSFIDEPSFVNIKLMDFGISKIISNDTQLTEIIGTLRFTAPEVLMGRPYNKQIDNWSFGIMLYLLFSGQYPFDDESEENCSKRIVYEDLTFKEDIWDKASPELKDLISNCLIKDPTKRFNILKILKHPFFNN